MDPFLCYKLNNTVHNVSLSHIDRYRHVVELRRDDVEFGDGMVVCCEFCSDVSEDRCPFIPMLYFFAFGMNMDDVDSVGERR